MTCTTNDTMAPLAVPPIDHPAPLIIAGATPNRARSAPKRESSATSGVGRATSVLLPSSGLTSPTVLALASPSSSDNDRSSHEGSFGRSRTGGRASRVPSAECIRPATPSSDTRGSRRAKPLVLR